jgi:transposase
MNQDITDTPAVTIGVDVGDKSSEAYAIDGDGAWLKSETVPTTRAAVERAFAEFEGARVVMEIGTHSPWMSRVLSRRGFEVIVANSRRVRLIAAADRKTDKIDAECLARLGRIDADLLAPITHRGRQAQQDLLLLRTRHGLVESRTKLINMARGQAKSLGLRIPRCSAPYFHRHAATVISEDSLPGITALLSTIEFLTERIQEFDRRMERVAAEHYPETAVLRQIHGVGAVTALCFVLTIEDPSRFSKSREVGAYLGLTPRQRDSGGRQPQLGITKRGDVMLRRLLVSCARYILGPFGKESDLRSHGLKLSASGGRAARNRAAIAVARKLAVLMHRLWVTGEVYEPCGYRRRDAKLWATHNDEDSPPTTDEIVVTKEAHCTA